MTHLINAPKLPANQQLGGDSPVGVLVEGGQARSRLKSTEELRRFIMLDNHEAVKIGVLKKTRSRFRWWNSILARRSLKRRCVKTALRRGEEGTQ